MANKRGRLPLHYACAQSKPKRVVRLLLAAFPAGAAATDKRGYLPLHHAATSGAQRAILQLVSPYPEGLTATTLTKNGEFLPWQLACINKVSLNVVYFLVRTQPTSILATMKR